MGKSHHKKEHRICPFYDKITYTYYLIVQQNLILQLILMYLHNTEKCH